MEKLIEILGEREDVQAWQSIEANLGTKRGIKLDKESVQVQTFDKLNGKDRAELGETLRTMERDNEGYVDFLKAGENVLPRFTNS
jgi:hypothetical protein